MDRLSEQADLVFKAVAVTSRPVEDAWFDKVWAFETHATETRILSVYKGKTNRNKIAFHHYAPGKEEMGMMYMPQNYEFEPGRIYIVIAEAIHFVPCLRWLTWPTGQTCDCVGYLRAEGSP